MGKFNDISIKRDQPAQTNARPKTKKISDNHWATLRFDENGEVVGIMFVNDGIPTIGADSPSYSFEEIIASGKFSAEKVLDSCVQLTAFGLNEARDYVEIATGDEEVVKAIAECRTFNSIHARYLQVQQSIGDGCGPNADWIARVQDEQLTPSQLASACNDAFYARLKLRVSRK